MIILEGPDCGGKTTLAAKLSKEYDSPITHYSSHHGMGMLEHAVTGKPGVGDIIDRFHYSEIPYSLYYRKVEPEYVGVNMITRALLARQVVVILCLPPWLEVKKKWYIRREKELIKTETKLHRIYKWYDKIEEDGIPRIKYDYTSNTIRHVLRKIENLINITPDSDILEGQPCGRFHDAKVLLVGEDVGNIIQREVPFTGVKGSGPWFTQQLIDAEIPEKDLAWINVKLEDGTSNMPNVVDTCNTCGFDYVIALGGVAIKALDDEGIKHLSYSHPQYWKRFQNKEEYPLIYRLKEITNEN